MLILSRKRNESVIINDDITVVVVEIRGDKVRLGIEAPKQVPVHYNEVYEAIRRNQATKSPDESAGKGETIRRQIEDLRQQILNLEAELAAL